MVILGIHDGADSSVALMINGKIVYASQEERFTRLKLEFGLPINAIKDCMNTYKIVSSEIDEVALATKYVNPLSQITKREANFTTNDWIEEQEKFWKPRFYQNKNPNYWNIFKNKKKFSYDKIYNYKNVLNSYQNKKNMEIFLQRRINTISNVLKIDKKKIKVYLHEDCHINYAYYFYKERKNGICITNEGMGDFSRGSVSTVKNNKFKLISFSKDNHLGNIYKWTTLLLGMKPAQHEYKVMGLAPYASDFEIDKCYKTYEDLLRVNKLNVNYKKKPKDIFYHLQKNFMKSRFDGIAGALQKFLENKLFDWFLSCSKILKLKYIYFSGGVAQNIKAAMYLNSKKKFTKVIIPPSAGDSSISIGACFKSMNDYCEKKFISKNKSIKPIQSLYLGYKNSSNDVKKFIIKKKLSDKYIIKKNVTSNKIALKIYNGKIVGRCVGRMEFGLRALGNRSILCDPRYFSNIRKINTKIKNRDFWMPFTPTILSEDFNKYIKNTKNLNASFMSMAFETKKLAQKDLQAAIHPADYTARPQKLSKNDNESYYNLIKEFKKLSGVGALLNTSLNLHGLPVARNIEDAMYVFENSELDILIVENYYFEKNL